METNKSRSRNLNSRGTTSVDESPINMLQDIGIIYLLTFAQLIISLVTINPVFKCKCGCVYV